MRQLMWIAIAVFATMLFGTALSHAQGWEYFRLHVHPTGRCGGEREVGASYYSDGSRTASGERFDRSAMTAASNAGGFAMGSRIHLHNPITGRSVDVRINDILPRSGAAWAAGVRLDLSPAAFRALGMTASGWVCTSP